MLANTYHAVGFFDMWLFDVRCFGGTTGDHLRHASLRVQLLVRAAWPGLHRSTCLADVARRPARWKTDSQQQQHQQLMRHRRHHQHLTTSSVSLENTSPFSKPRTSSGLVTHVYTIHKCDRQTDGQTDRQTDIRTDLHRKRTDCMQCKQRAILTALKRLFPKLCTTWSSAKFHEIWHFGRFPRKIGCAQHVVYKAARLLRMSDSNGDCFDVLLA